MNVLSFVEKYICERLKAQENLGMVMVFTIISALQEKLVEVVENVADDIRNEKERREREIEEAEQVQKML